MRRNSILFFSVLLFVLGLTLFSIKKIYLDKEELLTTEIELDGSGSYEYPYLISSADDLDYLRDLISDNRNLLGIWFELTNDIDYEGESIEPMVDIHTMNSFTGGFNGNGYTISGFVINKYGEEGSFWGRVDGVIENLTLEGKVIGKVGAGFAQDGHGEIINCMSKCDVEATAISSGVVNNWSGSLRNIVFDGKLTGETKSGIVTGGSGIGEYLYTNKYEIGDLASIAYGGVYNSTITDEVIAQLNQNARLLFLNGGYYIHLNSFYENEGMEISREPVAFMGYGTENNPYIIGSAEDFGLLLSYLEMGVSFEDKYFWQVSDVFLDGDQLNIQTDNCASFLGVYDGNGHALSLPTVNESTNGLFKKFDGILINCKIESLVTEQGYGFAEHLGDSAMFINSYMSGVYLTDYLEIMNQSGRLVNSYIQNVNEPTIEDLNRNLKSIVVRYGIHCGELYTWKEELGNYLFDANYKNIYLEADRTYFKGSGVEKNPYIIKDIYDFVYLRECVYYNENFFRLWFVQEGDIDFSDIYYWKAISCESSENVFFGNYNGNGYRIINFSCDKGREIESKSLFGTVAGTIFNVYIVGYENGAYNGVIANDAQSSAKIYNNIIQTAKNPNLGSSVAIVNSNSGNLYNNIFLYDEQFSGARVVLKDGTSEEENTYCKYNYVLPYSEFVESNVNNYNRNSIFTSLELKRRITLLNEMKYEDNVITIVRPITLYSKVGLRYLLLLLKKNPLLLISVLATIVVITYLTICFINSILRKKFTVNQYLEIEAVAAIHLGFYFVIKRIRPELHVSFSIGVLFSILTICFIGICVYIVRLSVMNKIKLNLSIFSNDRKLWGRIILKTLVFGMPAIIGIFNINTPISYDADLYYGSFQQAIQNFQLSITGFLDSFSIASKPMHGVAIILLFGEILNPGTGKGIYILNILLLLVAQYFVYRMIGELFREIDDKVALILSLCFTLSGYVLSGATYINPDFYSLIFLTYFMWSVLFNHKIVGIYFSYLTLCSKPNMIVPYIVFCSGMIFYEYRKKNIKIKDIFLYLLPILFYLVLYFGPNSLNRVAIPADSENGFVITLLSRIFQYTCYGLIWIQEIVVLTAAFKYWCINRRISISSRNDFIILSMWMACFSQLCITIIGGSTLQLCPRYLTICALKNIVLTAWAIKTLKVGEKIEKIGILVFAGLLFVQLFKTIDPSIICTTDVKYDGLHYLNFPPKDQTGNDLTFYNYEYCKDARVADSMLLNMSANEIGNMYSDSRTPYKMALGSSSVYACYWDTEKKCRTYIPNDKCVRLRCKNITKGLSVKDEYWLDSYVVVLRNGLNRQIKTKLENKIKIEFDDITLYTY